MPTQNDAVSVMIDGVAEQGWESYEIDSDLIIPADDWQVRIGLKDRALPPAVKPFSSVTVKLDNDTILSGRVDTIEEAVEKNKHDLVLGGRDHAATLIDCAAPIFTATEVTLKQVINKVIKPLGLHKIRIESSKAVNLKKVSVEPGERAWSVLRSAAEANGLWPWFDPDGTLVIGGPDYQQPIVATIKMNKNGESNNANSITRIRNTSGQFSEVTVLGQSPGDAFGNGQHAIKAATRDKLSTHYRPEITTDYNIDNKAMAQSKSRKLLADSLLSADGFNIIVKGHRTEKGLLWKPGQRIQLQSEPHNINATYFIMGRKLAKSRSQGTRTMLRVKPDGLWIPDAYPKGRHQIDRLQDT